MFGGDRKALCDDHLRSLTNVLSPSVIPDSDAYGFAALTQ